MRGATVQSTNPSQRLSELTFTGHCLRDERHYYTMETTGVEKYDMISLTGCPWESVVRARSPDEQTITMVGTHCHQLN